MFLTETSNSSNPIQPRLRSTVCRMQILSKDKIKSFKKLTFSLYPWMKKLSKFLSLKTFLIQGLREKFKKLTSNLSLDLNFLIPLTVTAHTSSDYLYTSWNSLKKKKNTELKGEFYIESTLNGIQ